MAKTRHEREDEARDGLLEHIRDQVSSGVLVIRQMTDAERAHWDQRLPHRDVFRELIHEVNDGGIVIPGCEIVSSEHASVPSG